MTPLNSERVAIMADEEPLIPKHGGYRNLKFFQIAELIYDVTVRFCDRYIDRRSRTHDQMVQAARSGSRNIAEGSQAAGTSKKTELKLTNVGRASLEELRLDYESFLRQRELEPWPANHPALMRFKARRCATLREVREWVRDEVVRAQKEEQRPQVQPRGPEQPHDPQQPHGQKQRHGLARTSTDPIPPPVDSATRSSANPGPPPPASPTQPPPANLAPRTPASPGPKPASGIPSVPVRVPSVFVRGARPPAPNTASAPTPNPPGIPSPEELAANAALSLLNVCCHLLDRQLSSQAGTFENEGGFTERLYRVRQQRRQNPRPNPKPTPNRGPNSNPNRKSDPRKRDL